MHILPGDKDRLKAPGFFNTFEHSPVSDDWMQELYNYIILGYHPGSFHTDMFASNLYGAACHSHVSNKWSHIVAFMKWLGHHAPHECWGDKESVKTWLKMTPERRERILLRQKFIITDEELTFKILETQ